MKATERRMAILAILCKRRFEKVENLAFEFGVCEWTIRQDVMELSLSYPIYTKTGKYGGGVYVVDGYKLGMKYMTNEQTELLEKILPELTGGEFLTMQSIIKTFKEPKRGGK